MGPCSGLVLLALETPTGEGGRGPINLNMLSIQACPLAMCIQLVVSLLVFHYAVFHHALGLAVHHMWSGAVPVLGSAGQQMVDLALGDEPDPSIDDGDAVQFVVVRTPTETGTPDDL